MCVVPGGEVGTGSDQERWLDMYGNSEKQFQGKFQSRLNYSVDENENVSALSSEKESHSIRVNGKQLGKMFEGYSKTFGFKVLAFLQYKSPLLTKLSIKCVIHTMT